MLEADVPMIMRIGFGVVTLIFSLAICFLCWKAKSKISLVLFGLQWIFTTLAFHNILVALKLSPWDTPMFSENVSYSVGLCGVFWGISICFMLAGIYRIVTTRYTTK